MKAHVSSSIILLTALLAGCATDGGPRMHATTGTPTVSADSHSTAASVAKIDQLKTGSTSKEEVRSLLGAPHHVDNDPIWGEAWHYNVAGAPGTTSEATIYFGSDGKVWRVAR